MSSTELDLSTMAPPPGSRKKRIRLGRGEASGCGKTSGRGGKGQKGRKGVSIRRGFEGGQMPLYRRVPKLGFFSRKKTRGVNVYQPVSLDALNGFDNGAVIDVASLVGKGFVKADLKVKVLNNGTLSKKVTVKVHAVSASAKAKIEAAGGTVEIVAPTPAHVEQTA